MVEEVIRQTIQMLMSYNIEDASFLTRELLAFVLQIPKQKLIIQLDRILKQEEKERFQEVIQEVIEGKPLQYITHHQEFMKLDFYVDERVLIPQPDTETLVEAVLDLKIKNAEILDLCTGSGAIAISLAHYLEEAKIEASDISEEALEVAKMNNEKSETSVKLIKSDLFQEIPEKEYDVIVSNPPYIVTSVIPILSKQVRNEPIIALDGGKDGLQMYRKIIEKAYQYMKQDGYLCLEIGYDQKEAVLRLIEETKKYQDPETKKDLAGNDRCIIVKRR